MEISKKLGRNAGSVLESVPFNQWDFERTLDEDSDPPLIGYRSKDGAIQMNCDVGSENLRSLFFGQKLAGNPAFEDLPFELGRTEVVAKFGEASKSGGKLVHPILGEMGAWDRFQKDGFVLHLEYGADSEIVERVTIMRDDVAPL